MKSVIARVGALALAGAVVLACVVSAEPFVSVRVSQLQGTVSPILLPFQGQQVSSGDIAISTGQSGPTEGITYWDIAGVERPIQWPVSIQCDFFRTLGVESQEITLYGIIRALPDGRLGDLDVGVLAYTASGNKVIIININILATDVPALSLFSSTATAGVSPRPSLPADKETAISGTFEGLTQVPGGAAAWPDLARDIENVVACVAGTQGLPADFADRVARYYEKTAAGNELAFYFPATDTFQSADLKGGFALEVVPVHWYDILPSFEDLLRQQAERLSSFEDLLKLTWQSLTWPQKMECLKSFEDLLREQADRLLSFETLLWWPWPQPAVNFQYLQSFEDLLRRQASLLKSFEDLLGTLLTQDHFSVSP